MAGGNPPKPTSSSASSHRKSRWESSSNKPSAQHRKPSTSIPSSSSSKQPSNRTTPTHSTPTTTTKPPTPKPKPSNPTANTTVNPSPRPDLSQSFPFQDPTPPPSYGFHMLERRTILLADGSVRSYFALPPDYENVTSLPPEFRAPHALQFPMSPEFLPEMREREREEMMMRSRNQEYWNSLGPGPENASAMKRKYMEDEVRGDNDGFYRQRQQLLQYGNAGLSPSGAGPSGLYRGEEEMRPAKHMRTFDGSRDGNLLKHDKVDQSALKKTFLHYVMMVFENANLKTKYLADGKQGPLKCLVCSRSSEEFRDMHSLIMHAYNKGSPDLLMDHLGLHKALCILMGWNPLTPPNNSKGYQHYPADEAAANQDDLILWPPMVIIHNTMTGKGRDGRMEGLGNRAMDNYLRDLRFSGGKSKSLYSREGHMGITLVKFGGDHSGLKEASRLAEYFEKDGCGRKGWARLQSSLGKDDENNPNLVKVDEKTGEKKRIFYGHLATICDLEKLDFETKKKVLLESRSGYKTSK